MPTIDSILFLLAQTAASPEQPTAPWWANLLPFVALFGFVYFVLIRPQQQMKKQQEDLITSAKSGDRVITTSGMLGVIANVRDKTFIIKVSEGVKIEFLKTAVSQVIKAADVEKERDREREATAASSEADADNDGASAANGDSTATGRPEPARQEVPYNRSKKRRGR